MDVFNVRKKVTNNRVVSAAAAVVIATCVSSKDTIKFEYMLAGDTHRINKNIKRRDRR